MDNKLDIGNRIKSIRLKKGISQKELCEKLNISQSKLSKIENNEVNYDVVYFILDFCKETNVSISEFFSEKISINNKIILEKIKILNEDQKDKLIAFLESLKQN